MHLKKPAIAAISGYAVAGGLELSLLCDMRIMEEDAIMGVFCRRFGNTVLFSVEFFSVGFLYQPVHSCSIDFEYRCLIT